ALLPPFLVWSFCYRSRLLRRLHSFPTRRSSDLRDHVRNLHDSGLEGLDGIARAGHEDQHNRVGDADDLHLALTGADGLEEHEILDRKSTRLNSSHLVISYAVFCLKKIIPFGLLL